MSAHKFIDESEMTTSYDLEYKLTSAQYDRILEELFAEARKEMYTSNKKLTNSETAKK